MGNVDGLLGRKEGWDASEMMRMASGGLADLSGMKDKGQNSGAAYSYLLTCSFSSSTPARLFVRPRKPL